MVKIIYVASLAFLGLVHVPTYADAANYAKRDDIVSYVDDLVREHEFERDELLALFEDVERNERVLELIARPTERRLEWFEYRKILVDRPRIELGVEFWNQNEQALARAHDTFGVAPEYIVAIIGVETRYGRIKGSYSVLDTLTTLGFDYPPRSGFFRGELTQFLLLVREERRDPRELTGSYAGAMGYGQFIPSSYRGYAVDFDGDGIRDIWTNEVDAIGSVANYFRRHGWSGETEVVVPAQVPDDALQDLANGSFKPSIALSDLHARGVRSDLDDAEAQRKVALIRLVGSDGPEYWLGTNDFYVITRYNRSSMYALAVHQLSQAIKERRSRR